MTQSLISFDDPLLVRRLSGLGRSAMLAFAIAAAARQVRAHERLSFQATGSEDHHPREVVTKLWAAKELLAVDVDQWHLTLDEIMGRLPAEDRPWTILDALADHGLSSLAYAIRCLLDPLAHEAAWADRRVYEAVDQAAMRMLDVEPGAPGAEAALLSHPWVQRELGRQERDLGLLQAGNLDAVEEHATRESVLSDEEINSLL